MLGWSINIHRGGHVEGNRIVGGKRLFQTDPIGDPCLINKLFIVNGVMRDPAPEVVYDGGGYPFIYRVPVAYLKELLEKLDKTPRFGRSGETYAASRSVGEYNLPDDELVLVEAWDQS